jgi:hypothetical protein
MPQDDPNRQQNDDLPAVLSYLLIALFLGLMLLSGYGLIALFKAFVSLFSSSATIYGLPR